MSAPMIEGDYRRYADPIEVVRYGPVYSASVLVSVRPGSPYRAMFMSGAAIARGWGFSAEAAARRCSNRRRKIVDGDDAYDRDRKRRVRYFDENELSR